MKKSILILIAGVLISLNTFAQQELSLHFMQELNQSKRLNPAIENPYKLHFGIASPGVNFASSAFSLNDIFITNGENEWFLNLDTTLSNLKPIDNSVQLTSDIETISFGIEVGKIQFSFFHRLNFDAGITYPKILPDYLWYGNSNYIGELIDLAPKIDMISYHEFAFGAALPVSPKVRIGAHFKYLQGIIALETDFASLNFYTDPEFYQLTVGSNLNFFTSGLSPDFFRPDSDDFLASDSDITFLFNNNRGLALDLGLNYQLNDKISLAFSALDLGMIVWQSSVYKHKSKGIYTFDGFDVNPFRSDADISFDEVIDTLREELEFTSKAEGFTSRLRPKFYFSGSYHIQEGLYLGGLFYGDIYQNRFNPAFAVNLRQELGKVQVGTLLNLKAGGQFNIGLNGSVQLGPVQVFGMTNSLTSLLSLRSGKNTTFRVGINLVFKKQEKENKIEEQAREEDKAKSEGDDSSPNFINPWNNN